MPAEDGHRRRKPGAAAKNRSSHSSRARPGVRVSVCIIPIVRDYGVQT